MVFKEIDVNRSYWIDSFQERLCECDIGPPGSISHGDSLVMVSLKFYFSYLLLVLQALKNLGRFLIDISLLI
jgi:hypothetical protein